jgi:flagellar biosynthesis protein FlhG
MSASIATQPLRRPRLIAVASGKGGVGKTWLSVTLSRALVQAGRRVMLFDGDLGLANVDIQLGIMPEHDLTAVIAGRRSVSETAVPYPAGGFTVLAGRSGSGALSTMDPQMLDRVLAALAAETSVTDIVLDLGAGLDRSVRRMAAVSDTLLVVATEEPTSLTDAYAVLKLANADRPGGDVRLVVNQASSKAAAERTYATLAQASAKFLGRKPPLAGVIRKDDHVRDAIRRQVLLQTRHPNTPAAQDVERLATLLTS